MKVVINKCFGGFGLSQKACEMYGGIESYYDIDDTFEFRTSEKLISIVEELGKEANGAHANLQIIEVPEDAIDPYIDEYDGIECVREGRVWE